MQDSAGVWVGMVETRVGGEIVEGAGSAGFGIGDGVDQAAYAGSMEGASAHGAGLEGTVEGAAGEAPALHTDSGAAEGEEFGMGGGVLCGLTFVVGNSQDLLSSSDHGADRNLTPFGGLPSLFEGAAHKSQVLLGGFGIRFPRVRLFRLVVAVESEFFGHNGDDDNKWRAGYSVSAAPKGGSSAATRNATP